MPKGITWPGYKGAEVYFAGVPGVYAPGRVVPLESVGRTEAEMAELIVGTPLKIVDVNPEPKKKEGEPS